MGNNNYIKQRHERDREMFAAVLNMGMQIVAEKTIKYNKARKNWV